MKVCLVDAWRADDSTLGNSHWVAETTSAVLRARQGVEIESLSGAGFDAAAVECALSRPHDGYVYFGHGRDDLLYREKDNSGAPIPLLGGEQVGRIGSRWFHAFACLTGNALCRDAAKAGVAIYLGYRVPVVVEWEISRLPEELSGLLADLVTVATMALVEGRRSRGEIRRRVREASDRLVEWLDVNDAVCASLPWIEITGLHMLANLLHRHMEMEGSAALP